jgi:hypothetical protein
MRLPALAERAVRLAEQEVARILRGEIGHGLDVAFGDEQVDEAVVVHVLEIRVPSG